MCRFTDNKLVYSCGTEGGSGTTLCRFCGNCLREFYATKERMANDTIKASENFVEDIEERPIEAAREYYM